MNWFLRMLLLQKRWSRQRQKNRIILIYAAGNGKTPIRLPDSSIYHW